MVRDVNCNVVTIVLGFHISTYLAIVAAFVFAFGSKTTISYMVKSMDGNCIFDVNIEMENDNVVAIVVVAAFVFVFGPKTTTSCVVESMDDNDGIFLDIHQVVIDLDSCNFVCLYMNSNFAIDFVVAFVFVFDSKTTILHMVRSMKGNGIFYKDH